MSTLEESSTKLTTLIVVFPLVALLLYGGLSHLFFFYTQHKEAKQELIKYENTLMDSEKVNLEEKVNNLAQFIHYYDSRSSEKIKEEVKNIVNISVNVANNLYETYKDKVDEATLKDMIKAALRKIKFEGEIGYLFMLNIKGDTILHFDKKMQGTNVIDIQDVKGKYIIKEFNKVLKAKGEGFVDYYWYIVSKDHKSIHYKISFVKMLNCYDWYIGSGEYLKYMAKFIQTDILEYIKANAEFKNGYFFIKDSNGELIFHPEGRDNTEIISKLFQEGIHRYGNHIAYTQYIKEYGWYVTAIMGLDGIHSNIEYKKYSSEVKRVEDIKINLYLLMFSWFVSIWLSLYLSSIINRKLRNYESQLYNTNEKLIFQSRQALIGELFSMIAHQWRQPINKIASILALLRFKLPEEKLDYQEVDKKYHEIEESIEFMSETIDDFRTFYQPKEASQEVSLKILIHKSIDFISGAIYKKEIKITTELENISFQLHTNEFLQVMINLIKNSCDSVSQQGKIHIRLYQQGSKIIISVEDNGIGIDKTLISKVFDPYFTTKKDSMGLGLYMSKMIIEKHMKGSIKAQNIQTGTRFIIKL